MKLAAGALVLAAALGLLVTLWFGSKSRGLEAHCRNNLRHLGGLAARNWNTIELDRSGRNFWQAVREAQYRDVFGKWQPIKTDPFVCPVLGTTVSKVDDASTIDYRGPVKMREQLNSLPKTEPLGADRIGNHPSGGHVLLLDSSVKDLPRVIERVKDGDALWRAAAEVLKD